MAYRSNACICFYSEFANSDVLMVSSAQLDEDAVEDSRTDSASPAASWISAYF